MAESFLFTVVCSMVLEAEFLQEHRAREAMMETHVFLPLSSWSVGSEHHPRFHLFTSYTLGGTHRKMDASEETESLSGWPKSKELMSKERRQDEGPTSTW